LIDTTILVFVLYKRKSMYVYTKTQGNELTKNRPLKKVLTIKNED